MLAYHRAVQTNMHTHIYLLFAASTQVGDCVGSIEVLAALKKSHGDHFLSCSLSVSLPLRRDALQNYSVLLLVVGPNRGADCEVTGTAEGTEMRCVASYSVRGYFRSTGLDFFSKEVLPSRLLYTIRLARVSYSFVTYPIISCAEGRQCTET